MRSPAPVVTYIKKLYTNAVIKEAARISNPNGESIMKQGLIKGSYF